MFFKIHKSYREVVAICDSDLIGKKFEEGKFQLDVKEDFFKSQENSVTEEEIISLLKKFSDEDSTFNIIGERSINSALKAGIISQEGIKKVQGIPFALVLM